MEVRKYLILAFTFCLYDHVYCDFFEKMSDYYCDWIECCDEKRVPYNLESLEDMLSTKLYGQHIAQEVVFTAIRSHLKKSKKPLVLSFHGANGVGKTYVSKMIARAFYKFGDNSRHFHFYYGLQNFPLIEKLSEYQAELKKDIEAGISSCERSFFVFDGVDQMPAGLLNILMPFIDCPSCSGNKNKNKSIFIFLTNTGSEAIQKKLIEKLNMGYNRLSTTLQDFEKIIINATLNHSGGLFESLMIKSDAITFYIPFLPLEKQHVNYCITEAFEELNVSPTKHLIGKVFQELRFGPEPEDLFSNGGCKRVAQIVGRVVSKLNPKFDDFKKDYSYKTEF